jgi:predicted SAM-dependent methyltransferase
LPNEIKDKKYDYIICSHVLEHIAFPTKSLDDLYNLAIKNSSTVVIMLPNIMYYKTRLKLLKGDFEYTNDGIMDYTHLRWYTLKSATNLFQSYGFEIDTSRVEGFLPFHSFLSKLKESQYNILKKILYKTSPTFWGSELVFSLKIK